MGPMEGSVETRAWLRCYRCWSTDLEEIVRDAVWRKELKHHVNDPGFVQPERSMSQIGG